MQLCYHQLTPAKTKCPLTGNEWPYPGLKFSTYQGACFLKLPVTKCWSPIGSLARIKFICCNANPGLKVNRSIVFTSLVSYSLKFILKIKTKGQTTYRKPHCKVTKLKSKFSLILVSLIRFWTTWSRGSAFLSLAKSIYVHLCIFLSGYKNLDCKIHFTFCTSANCFITKPITSAAAAWTSLYLKVILLTRLL